MLAKGVIAGCAAGCIVLATLVLISEAEGARLTAQLVQARADRVEALALAAASLNVLTRCTSVMQQCSVEVERAQQAVDRAYLYASQVEERAQFRCPGRWERAPFLITE